MEICFAKEFHSSNFEDAVLCFSTVTIKQPKRSIAFLLHTNSVSSCRCSPSDRSVSLLFDSSVVAKMIGMSAAEG